MPTSGRHFNDACLHFTRAKAPLNLPYAIWAQPPSRVPYVPGCGGQLIKETDHGRIRTSEKLQDHHR
ncbi:hypothetical protein SAMN04488118_101239 [Epibacterium ulvae]|uniref:Uncharacterized protein n=1 Tax=Epibacterium ulvae TaxID=1156985 RepID=A0A1G5PLE1_9RHOB|nr:hypothetical protein SAMN04488118_101239 [Epibacterium ulvae]